MDLEFLPYEGLGQLRFGMSRSTIRALMAVDPKPFKKTPASKMMTDAFGELGVHVYYDPSDSCEAIEAFSPATPVFLGTVLLGKSFSDVRDLVLSVDPASEIDGAGLIAFGIGLALYAPSAMKAPDLPVESVMAFRKGYYD